MFSSSVCLILQTWCQLLNLSAADNEDTPGDDVFALRSGTLLAVPEYGSTDHSPEADWDTKIKGATLNPQGTASGGRFSQQKLFAELKDYKLVIPHVLSGKQKRSVAVLLQRNYANHVGISVQLDGEDLMLDLRRNKLLLPRGFQVSHYDSNGTLVTEQDTELYHCYYEGSVRSYPGSQVSASTCSGLSALVVLSNRTYVIEHLEGDKLGRHLIYRPEDLKSVPSRCGVTKSSPELTLTEHLQRSQRMKRDVLQETRHIEMVLVADNILYQYLDFNKDAVVRRLINTANTVDLLVSAGSVCRLVMGECDLPEVCTGTSSDCPSNTYVKDGHPCGNGNIYCSTGVCQSADKQCQEIWGEGAVSAETICYEVTNSQGSVYGNCGRNQNDEYIKCTDQDAVCGKIQCKGGNEKPIQGGVLNSVTTSLDYRGVHYECRGTSITSGDASSTDLVRQGTKCGDNKVCIDAKCQDVALLNVESCDETCNGHGACNNNDNCHCDMGWDPPYCQTSGRGGSIDSGTVIGTRTTPTPETREANTTRLQQTTREITAPTPETREANTTRLQQTTREITGKKSLSINLSNLISMK
uniref:disintegrin and metalloproteinase domain-containing protein 19-like n=1 Tax=Pristiophorus japonicus TaxID=55135 RepID=UPI00398EBF4A